MTDEKGSSKGMTDEEILSNLKSHHFFGKIIEIMKTGDYQGDNPELVDDDAGEIEFGEMDNLSKALFTYATQTASDMDREKQRMRAKLSLYLMEFLQMLIFCDPLIAQAMETIENSGVNIKKGWKIVFLPPLTEEILRDLDQVERGQASLFQRMFGRG